MNATGRRLLSVCALSLLIAGCTDPAVKKAQHFEKGNTLLAAGKYQDAIIEYRNAIKIDRQFGDARFKLAEAYEKTENDQAGKEYLRAADLLPKRADVQLKAATLLLAGQQFEMSRKYADQAIAADPKLIDAQIVRAHALAGMKDTAGAIAELEKATASAPGDYRPYTSLGAVAAGSGNKAEAEAAFKKAVETDPSSTHAKLALSYFYISSGKGEEGERILLDALKADPSNASANRLLSLFYIGNRRLDEAETPLLRLVDAKDVRASLLLGDVYMSNGKGERARPLFEKLKEDKKTRALAVSRLATLDYTAGRREEAIGVLDAELKASPKSLPLLALKARWLVAANRAPEALDAANAAVAVDAQSPEAQFVLGMAQNANRNPTAATAAYREVLRLNPAMAAAEVELSKLMLATGQSDQALRHAEAARKAAPTSVDARFTIARAFLQKGDVRAAEAEAVALTNQFPKSAAVHSLYGQVLLKRGDNAGAIREFEKALAIDPADVSGLTGRIALDLSAKRPQEARARIERALAAAPSNSVVLLTASELERVSGNPSAAESHLRKAIESDPANLEVYNRLARLYISQKKLDEGTRELEEIVKRKPDAMGARTMIGMLQEIQGQPDKAVATYDKILNETSKAPIAANNLAYIYAERGEKLDRAVELAQSAKQQMPENADVSDTLGWVYYKKGLPELAVKPLEFSVQKDPQNPLYLLHVGLAYAKAGMTDKARTALTQALKLNANVAGADQGRAALASLTSSSSQD